MVNRVKIVLLRFYYTFFINILFIKRNHIYIYKRSLKFHAFTFIFLIFLRIFILIFIRIFSHSKNDLSSFIMRESEEIL